MRCFILKFMNGTSKKRSLHEILELFECNRIMDLYRCDKTRAK